MTKNICIGLVLIALVTILAGAGWLFGPKLWPRVVQARQAMDLSSEDHGSEECTEHGEEGHAEHAEEGHDDHGEEEHDEHGEEGHAEHAEKGHDDHEEDDHDGPKKAAAAKQDDHAGGHEGHDDNEERVELTPEQRERVGLKIATAGRGTIAMTAAFPGEVILNPDRTVHVVPRAAGIVRQVERTLGDRVKLGEILAWIESDELGEAKLAFYDKVAEVGCCKIELPRAKAIFENSNKLLTMLEKEPEEDELRKLAGLEMGEYRGRLLTAYAEYTTSKKSHERQLALHGKNISSEKQLLEAEAAFKKADAELVAAKDTTRYQVLIAYSEAARKRQLAEFEAVAAEQRLRLKGAEDEVIERLRALTPKTANLKPCLCDDPNCKEGELPSVLDTLSKDRRFAWYALRAPFEGVITEKHLTLGEKVGSEESAFTIADTSNVWVRFGVYLKDVASVRTGQRARVHLTLSRTSNGAHPQGDLSGAIAYVSPVADERTRTVPARIVLENADGALRPGQYVTVHVDIQAKDAPVVIPKSAVQVLDEKQVVFIEDGDGFEAVQVKLGSSDRERIVVTSGLRPGQRYVVLGGFELKAKIVTSGLGAHAGHGH